MAQVGRHRHQEGYEPFQPGDPTVQQVTRREEFGINLADADEIVREVEELGLTLPGWFVSAMSNAVTIGRFTAWATVNIYRDGTTRIISARL
jgi:hypothetical protein